MDLELELVGRRKENQFEWKYETIILRVITPRYSIITLKKLILKRGSFLAKLVLESNYQFCGTR